MESSYAELSEAQAEVQDYHEWDTDRLGLYFRSKGLGDYCDALREHNVTGDLAPLLDDQDLKDMGIRKVGDRLTFKKHLTELSRRERFNRRTELLWTGTEQLFFSNCEAQCVTCLGLCPIDPSAYKLTSNHLRVKRVTPVRCGPVRLCCFGASYVSNNVDLSKVDDVDVIGTPAPCPQRTLLCADGKDLVEVESRFQKNGKVSLVLREGEGEGVASLIMNQVEESQKMQRD